ncbi:MAG TPA: hypothetical protein VM012_13385 [Flavitalea sp.]|nr:hypothetical protein [Flavitalea sp.]
MKQIAYLAATCSILLFSCKKESKPESTTQNARVIYQLTTTERTSSLAVNPVKITPGTFSRNLQASSITWMSGIASISEIRFKASTRSEDDDDFEFEYSSPVARTIDLFSVLPTIGLIAVPPADYKKIEFRLKFEPVADQPAFKLTGSFTNDAGLVIPIVISIDQPFEVKFKLKTPEKINANIDYAALNELALGLLMNGISAPALRNAVLDNDGRLFISANKNGALFKTVWNNFKVMLKVKMKKK